MRISMHSDHKIFIQAIQDMKKVIIQHRNDDGHETCTKICLPLFYIPAGGQDSSSQYYFWEGVSGPKGNIVKVKTEQIIRIGPTQESFGPAAFKLVNDENLPYPSNLLENTP
jgi:hypothetical protein